MRKMFTPGVVVRAVGGSDKAEHGVLLAYEGEGFYHMRALEREGQTLVVHEDDVELAVLCWRCHTYNFEYIANKKFEGKWRATCRACGYVEGLFPVGPGERVGEAHQKWLNREKEE